MLVMDGIARILLAIVEKLAVDEVLTPLSVIALAISAFPLLTDVFKELRSVCLANSIEVPEEFVPKNFVRVDTKTPCVRANNHLTTYTEISADNDTL